MNLDDLKLSPGFPVQLQVGDGAASAAKYACKLVGYIGERGVLVTLPRSGDKVARLRPGQKLTARLMIANGICLFASSVESIIPTPFPMVFLAYPKSVSFKGIRGSTRIDTKIDVTVVNESDLEARESPGQIADISTGGARLEMPDVIGAIGDQLSIRATVPIGPFRRKVSITSVIRSRVERSTREMAENLPAVFGVEFTETDEEQKLLLHAFVYSEMSHQHEFKE